MPNAGKDFSKERAKTAPGAGGNPTGKTAESGGVSGGLGRAYGQTVSPVDAPAGYRGVELGSGTTMSKEQLDKAGLRQDSPASSGPGKQTERGGSGKAGAAPAGTQALTEGPPASGMSTVAADYQVAESYGLTPDQYDKAVRQFGDAIADAEDTYEGPLTKFGNFLAGGLGYYESSENSWDQAVDDAKKGVSRAPDEAADRMLDGVSLALGLAGLAAGGIGTVANGLYTAGTLAFGRPEFGQINMGPGGPSGPPNGNSDDPGQSGGNPGARDREGRIGRDIPGRSFGAGTQALLGDSDDTAPPPAGTEELYSDVTMRDRRKPKPPAGTELMLG